MENLGIKTAHILVFSGNSVLLVRHGESAGHMTGTYGMPGERSEGEDLLEYPNNFYTADIPQTDGTTKAHVFVAKKFYAGLKAVQETNPEWINISQLRKYNLLPNVEKIVREGLENKKNI